MRKSTICLLAALLCSWVSSLGQDNHVPQWKVIKEGHVFGGTAAIPLTGLFTPTTNGLYRYSAYMSVSSKLQQNAGWALQLVWTDQTGLVGDAALFPTLNNGSAYLEIDPHVFSPQVGTAVLFSVSPSTTPPQEATYDIAFTVEKLTKQE